VNKKSKNNNVKPFMVKNHLWVFINTNIENPAFDSQVRHTADMLMRGAEGANAAHQSCHSLYACLALKLHEQTLLLLLHCTEPAIHCVLLPDLKPCS